MRDSHYSAIMLVKDIKNLILNVEDNDTNTAVGIASLCGNVNFFKAML